MESSSGYQHLSAFQDVWISQVYTKKHIVFCNRRTQEQRTLAGEPQGKKGEKSRSIVIQPLLAGSNGLNVTISIEETKGLIVFDNLGPIIEYPRSGLNVELVANSKDFFHRTVRSC